MANALKRYLESNEIKDGTFADLIDRDRSLVYKLQRDMARPSLDLAAKIESVTDGAVPMQAWASAATDPNAKAAA